MNIPGLNSGLVGLLSSVGFDIILPGVMQSFAAKLRREHHSNAAAAVDALSPLAPELVHGDVKGQRKVVDAAIAALQTFRSQLDAPAS